MRCFHQRNCLRYDAGGYITTSWCKDWPLVDSCVTGASNCVGECNAPSVFRPLNSFLWFTEKYLNQVSYFNFFRKDKENNIYETWEKCFWIIKLRVGLICGNLHIATLIFLLFGGATYTWPWLKIGNLRYLFSRLNPRPTPSCGVGSLCGGQPRGVSM